MAWLSQKWRRIGKWIFWITTILGVLIAIPLLKTVWPFLEVLWATRSEAALEANPNFRTNQTVTLSEELETLSAEATAEDEIANLESHLDQISHLDLDQREMERMMERIAAHFGAPEPSDADPEVYDEDSAVFADVNKVIREIDGVRHHIYIVEMKDRNGNRTTFLDSFEKPDAYYERTMQVMKMMRKNAQLKHIYDAVSPILANMANEREESAQDESAEVNLEEILLEEERSSVTESPLPHPVGVPAIKH